MVYQVFYDGIDSRHSLSSNQSKQNVAAHTNRTSSKKRGKSIRKTRGRPFLAGLLPNYLSVQTESRIAALLIVIIKILLFLYDLVSLPIYFFIQRPDKRSLEAQRIQSHQVDSNTWIRMHKQKHPILLRNKTIPKQQQKGNKFDSQPIDIQFMGSTPSEVFAKSIEQNWPKLCLGYRAVVTCPVLTCNELGEHVMQDKSFRSNYTWYTYGQIGQRVQDIASGLNANSVFPQSRALFLASTSLEWFCTAQACFQLAVQLVLAPDINDSKILKQILDETQAECIFVSCDKLATLCGLIDIFEHSPSCTKSNKLCHCFAIKRIIIIDWPFSIDFNEVSFNQLGESLHDLQSEPTIEVFSIGQIEESGIENPIKLHCSRVLNCQMDGNLTHEQTSGKDRHLHNIKSQKIPLRRRTSGHFNSKLVHQSAGSNCNRSMSSDITRNKRPQSCPVDKTTNNFGQNQKTVSKGHTMCSNSFSRSSQSSRLQPVPNDLAVISYTFGPLGQLKAIILTHHQLTRCSNHLFLDSMVTGDDVHCTILQLDSLIELMIEMCVFSRGGSIGYSCNLNTLFYDGKELFKRDKSDLEALEPSFLMVRPYILERLRESLQNYLQTRLNPLMGFVMKNALYEYKKYWAQRHYDTPIVNRLFCSRLRRLFGSRLNFILCNGTADCSETKDFFTFMLDLPVIELYGPDEAVVSLISANDIWDYKRKHQLQLEGSRAVAGYGWRLFQFDHYEDDDEAEECLESKRRSISEDIERLLTPKVNKNDYRQDFSKNILFTSSILCPTYGTRIKLVNWEEFRLSDQPYPRGRLLIGGDVVCQGYLNRRPETALATNEVYEPFYQDSNLVNWFMTGDIARAFPNGSFEIISAISDLIKMVDGQFVSLSQIEHILRNSCFVDNVCAICGDDRSFVINLVVPNLRRLALKSPGEANLKLAIGDNDGSESDELIDIEFRREVCNDRLLSEFVGQHLSELLSKSGLSSIRNRFLLVPEIWTAQSELVTPSFEPKRAAIQKFYAADIQSIVSTMKLGDASRRLSARKFKMRKFSSPPAFC